MSNAAHPIPYASSNTPDVRPWSRAAVGVALGAVLQPSLSGALLIAANENWLPQHFLCCNHPGLATAWFVGAPALGFMAALLVCNRIVRHRPASRGLLLTIPAGALFALLVPAGMILMGALKA